MPTASTPLEFANALAERRSNTTKALDDLFRRPGNLASHPHFNDLNTSRYFDNPLRAWVKNELVPRGVTKAREFKHINQWPKADKERVRKALVHAIENNVTVRFFWELYGGAREKTIIVPEPLPTAGTITITFLSPQGRVRVSSAPSTFGEIFVDVG